MTNKKNILIIFLLLSIFAVGTQIFIEPVEASKWKLYDKGYSYSDQGYKTPYKTYIKDDNKIWMKFYWKNKHYSSIYLTVDKKKKLTITYYRAGKLQSKDTIKNLPMSVKKLYSVFKKNKHLLKFGRVPESKIKQSL